MLWIARPSLAKYSVHSKWLNGLAMSGFDPVLSSSTAVSAGSKGKWFMHRKQGIVPCLSWTEHLSFLLLVTCEGLPKSSFVVVRCRSSSLFPVAAMRNALKKKEPPDWLSRPKGSPLGCAEGHKGLINVTLFTHSLGTASSSWSSNATIQIC